MLLLIPHTGLYGTGQVPSDSSLDGPISSRLTRCRLLISDRDSPGRVTILLLVQLASSSCFPPPPPNRFRYICSAVLKHSQQLAKELVTHSPPKLELVRQYAHAYHTGHRAGFPLLVQL